MYNPYIFQVFVNDKGEFGNPGSLIVDEAGELDAKRRTAITAEIGHDETVFINDLTNNDVSIYHAYG